MNNKLQLTNFTCNGKCSGCGQCCGDILYLSKKEIKEIDKYIKKHNIKATSKSIMVEYDNTCPFRDNENKICKVYEVRPQICRVFKCDKSPEEAYINREFNNQTRLPRSMRNLFFKDDSGARWIKNILGTTIYDRNNKPIGGEDNE